MTEPDEADSLGLGTLETVWAERGVPACTVALGDDQTIVASERRLTVAADVLLENSRTLVSSELTPAQSSGLVTGETIELVGELGRGGMGIVLLGMQPSMRRKVAVKALYTAEAGKGPALLGLLKEAWVAGSLGHPNLVPVHSLAPHSFGAAVVMKRVEGKSWQDLIDHPTQLPEDADADPLGWHLRVLAKVCDAMSFAHSEKILHLDLKPDNVMVGDFGEVYVVDWGIAAGLPGAPSWLGAASDIRTVAGTPAYMAPELAAGDGSHTDARTDVYLLAAILNEVATGRPPHDGDSLMRRLQQAYRSEPKRYPGRVPQGLVTILHRGLCRDPAERYQSVAEFSEAIAGFVSSREADELVLSAREELTALELELQNPEPDELVVQRRFGAARYALRSALELRPGHDIAQTLQAEMHGALAGWALNVGRLELAESYLSELPHPDPSLTARLIDLQREQKAREHRVKELEQLAGEQSLHVASRFRRVVCIVLGSLFTAVHAVMGWAGRSQLVEWGYDDMLVTGGVTLLCAGLLTVWQRARFFSNKVNSDIVWVFGFALLSLQAHWLITRASGVPFQTSLALTPMYYLFSFGALATLVERRFFWSPLALIPSWLFASLYPGWAFEIVGLGGGAAGILMGVSWRVRADLDPLSQVSRAR